MPRLLRSAALILISFSFHIASTSWFCAYMSSNSIVCISMVMACLFTFQRLKALASLPLYSLISLILNDWFILTCFVTAAFFHFWKYWDSRRPNTVTKADVARFYDRTIVLLFITSRSLESDSRAGCVSALNLSVKKMSFSSSLFWRSAAQHILRMFLSDYI